MLTFVQKRLWKSARACCKQAALGGRAVPLHVLILLVSTCGTNPDGPILQQEAAPRAPARLSYVFQTFQMLSVSWSFCHTFENPVFELLWDAS